MKENGNLENSNEWDDEFRIRLLLNEEIEREGETFTRSSSAICSWNYQQLYAIIKKYMVFD